jgi:hypothetical protein
VSRNIIVTNRFHHPTNSIMMLSAQAARMGTVSTTLRQIGKKKVKNRFFTSSSSTIHLTPQRAKSTRAATISPTTAFYYEEAVPHQQHVIREPWMANLGLTDQSWLDGPRRHNWFTGKHPSECPGKSSSSSARRPYEQGSVWFS